MPGPLGAPPSPAPPLWGRGALRRGSATRGGGRRSRSAGGHGVAWRDTALAAGRRHAVSVHVNLQVSRRNRRARCPTMLRLRCADAGPIPVTSPRPRRWRAEGKRHAHENIRSEQEQRRTGMPRELSTARRGINRNPLPACRFLAETGRASQWGRAGFFAGGRPVTPQPLRRSAARTERGTGRCCSTACTGPSAASPTVRRPGEVQPSARSVPRLAPAAGGGLS